MNAYSPDDPKPLAGYAVLSAVFAGAVASYSSAHVRSNRKLPPRLPAGDFALMALATQKLSRLITKDRVTSFMRSPFTRYTSEAGPSEVSEEPRGEGLQRAIGEQLLVCPYCVGQWVAAGLIGAYIINPDATRFAAGMVGGPRCCRSLQQLWVAVDKQL
jgi:hypothetical protein